MIATMQLSGMPERAESQNREESDVKEEIDDMVEAVKFARAHNMQVVVSRLDAERGVPFYWRFVPVVR